MREVTQPGQVWCWGSAEHGSRAERLWLLIDVFVNEMDSLGLRDGLAVDLELGEQRPVFNLPATTRDLHSRFVDATVITWRRVL